MKMHTQICCWGWFNIVFNHVVCYAVDETYLKPFSRASDISRGRGPAKFRYFREIPRNYPEIFPNTCRQDMFNTYLGY